MLVAILWYAVARREITRPVVFAFPTRPSPQRQITQQFNLRWRHDARRRCIRCATRRAACPRRI